MITEFKDIKCKLELKESNESEGVVAKIRAYCLAFGNVDSWGDIIVPTACDEYLKGDMASRMALCWQHDRHEVIGKITDKGVDEYGMWIEADILPTTKGKDAAVLIKAGAITEMSIGYCADAYHYEGSEEAQVRVLDAITIYEASPVTIAANPNAKIVSAKEDAPEVEVKDNNDNINNISDMDDKMLNELQDELKSLKETNAALQGDITNLDATAKAQQAELEAIKASKAEEVKDFAGALKDAMESHKDDINATLSKHSGNVRIEFKADLSTGGIQAIAAGAVLEPGVSYARPVVNAFYDNIIKESVNGNTINWLEGEFTDAADYVAELAKAGDEAAAATERSRQFAKVAAHLLVSSEVADFYSEVYNWARTTAQTKVLAKIDSELLAGEGSDATASKKIYGLKGNSTTWTATGAKYRNATIADVIIDGVAQAAAAGYTVDMAFVSWADMAAIRGLKSSTGNYLYNEVTGILNGVRIIASSKLATGELMLIDSTCPKIKERPIYEFEVIRNGSVDGWDVYVRKSVQLVVKAADKAGVIYCSNVDTAIAAINTDK